MDGLMVQMMNNTLIIIIRMSIILLLKFYELFECTHFHTKANIFSTNIINNIEVGRAPHTVDCTLRKNYRTLFLLWRELLAIVFSKMWEGF